MIEASKFITDIINCNRTKQLHFIYEGVVTENGLSITDMINNVVSISEGQNKCCSYL